MRDVRFDPYELREMKAGMSVWELYNGVTDYASNNTFWDRDDSRRGMLQEEALTFLMKQRDIKNYNWDKEFILINPNIVCPNMKQNTLEDIYCVLKEEKNEITVKEEIREKAFKSINKMLKVGSIKK